VLSAVTPAGKELVVSTGAVGTRSLGAAARTLASALQTEVTSIPPKSRLRITIGSTSTVQNPGNLVYLNAAPDAAAIRIGRVTLTLPVLRTPVSR
jgi:hypothetical protein